MKIKNKIVGGGGICENSKKKIGGGRGIGLGGGVRVDVIQELKFLGKFTKKKWGGGGGVRVDVNEELKFL